MNFDPLALWKDGNGVSTLTLKSGLSVIVERKRSQWWVYLRKGPMKNGRILLRKERTKTEAKDKTYEWLQEVGLVFG